MEHQCYVITDSLSASVKLPSVVAEMHRAHLARIARIKTAAIGEKAKAAAKADDRMVELLEAAIEPAPKPRRQWFSIVDEKILPQSSGPMVEDIQRVACRYFNVTRNDMLSPRRDRRVSYPRHVAMYIAKTLTLQGLPQIGRRFGGRDHTTILHGVRKISNLILTDWEVAYDVAHVEAML